MASDRVRVICGPGYGKSASALGYAMMGVFRGKRVIMVQFLKGMIGEEAADVLKRLEPGLKFFCFELWIQFGKDCLNIFSFQISGESGFCQDDSQLFFLFFT